MQIIQVLKDDLVGSCLHCSSAFWVLNDDKNKILYFLKARSLHLMWGLSSSSIRRLGFQETSLALYLRKEFQFLPASCETTDVCSLGFHPALYPFHVLAFLYQECLGGIVCFAEIKKKGKEEGKEVGEQIENVIFPLVNRSGFVSSVDYKKIQK